MSSNLFRAPQKYSFSMATYLKRPAVLMNSTGRRIHRRGRRERRGKRATSAPLLRFRCSKLRVPSCFTVSSIIFAAKKIGKNRTGTFSQSEGGPCRWGRRERWNDDGETP